MTKAKKLKIPIITFEDLMKELPCDGCNEGVSNVYKSMHYCSWCSAWMKWEDYSGMNDHRWWELVCNINRPGRGHFCGDCYEEWRVESYSNWD